MFAFGIESGLAQDSVTFADQDTRATYVQATAQRARTEKAEAVAWAQARGRAVRVDDGQRTMELMFVRNGRPYYYTTHNANAAISTAADRVRNTSPYNVNGSGLTAGVWDAGSVLSTHQEFGTRVNVMDGAASHYHSTHVGGTIGAAGVVAAAEGMAPSVTIDSYDWNSDVSEMASRAASLPGEAGKLPLSNHSYGYNTGWSWNSGVSAYVWPHWLTWAADSEEDLFGQYDTKARDYDEIVYNAPYYLPFKSAGNDRNDNPSAGSTVYYSTDGGSTYNTASYNAALHPDGDGVYKSGYDTVGSAGTAKNVLTVGAVNDAVSGVSRSLAGATMSDFSGWGPADDGRIKPDVVANGVGLYSCDDDHNADYITIGGTSMSSPNAAGSAMLLVEYYGDLFPGGAMRASTLKGLILHTADDIGNAGPDYSYGWGLMNTLAAADLIKAHHQDSVDNPRLIEGQLTTANTSDSYGFVWNGTDPIRVTLCWTDPPGTATTAHDSTTPKLVNDLDLIVTGPGGSPTYRPYILNPASPSSVATTGENNIDNVEQVYIASPSAGSYTVRVDYDGSLTDAQQWYSIVISGRAAGVEPVSTFTATAVSTSRIDLAWTKNASNDNVVVAVNTVNSFGTPSDGTSYGVGSSIGAATVIYNGSGTVYQYTSLSADTRYYYQAWSVNGSTKYSAETAADAMTPAPPASLPYLESFESGFGEWGQATDDDGNWTRRSGSTPSSSTGPSGAQEGSYYIFTEATAGSDPGYPNKTASLELAVDFSGVIKPELSFYYHMYGTDMGSLYVDVYDGTWHLGVWSRSGQQHTGHTDPWSQAVVDLSAYGNSSGVKIRIRGVTGSSYRSDMAVDNISVHASVLEIVTANLPVGTVGGTYSASLEAANGAPPYAWSIEGGNLQAGLSLASNGSISGTPIASGTNEVTFTVEDSDGASTNKLLELVVLPATLDHFAWSAIASQQVVNVPFNVSLTAMDGNTNVFTGFTNKMSLSGLVGSGGSAAVTDCIANASFEAGSTSWASDSAGNYTQSDESTARGIMPTEGSRYWRMYTHHNTFMSSGDFAALDQNVDLTGVDELVFDVKLYTPGTWAGKVKAEVRVDDTALWEQTIEGEYTNQVIDVSSYEGAHSIQLRSEVVASGTFNSQWIMYDNLRTSGSTAQPVSVTPTNSGSFVAGVWTGTVTVHETATNMYLRADDGDGRTGDSTLFSVSTGATSHTITASKTGNGTVSPEGAVAVAHGGTTNFLIAANSGNHIESIKTNDSHVAGSPYSGNSFTSTNYVWGNIVADGTIAVAFEVTQYTLTFDSAGGSAVAPITQDYGTAVTAPTDPTRTGYAFAGWNPAVPETMPAENVTLTAQWTLNAYTVTFLLGEHGTYVSGEMEQTIEHGQAAIAPEFTVAQGWVFDGWDMEFDYVVSDLTVNAQYLPAEGTFARWLLDNAIDGDPDELFREVFPDRKVAYGFAYAFGVNLPEDGVLLSVVFLDGRPVFEIPLQDAATLPYVEVRVIGIGDLLDSEWNIQIVESQDTNGKPADCAWYEMEAPSLDKAFFRLEAKLK